MFFTHIDQIMTPGVDLTLIIHKSTQGLTVSTMPKINGLKDEAQHHIIPLTISGTPAEMDAGFMPAICQPVQKASGLLINISEFEKSASKAAANSKAEKEKQTKESKEAKEKKDNYEKYLKKADELMSQEKYSEGLTNLQQALCYAAEQNKKALNEKIHNVKMKMAQGSLFDMTQPAQTPQTQPILQAQPFNSIQNPVATQPSQTPQTSPIIQMQPVPQSTPVNQTQHYPQYGQMPQPQSQPSGQPQYPQHFQMPIVQNNYDPNYCRPEEYAQYPDFPGYENNLFNKPQL